MVISMLLRIDGGLAGTWQVAAENGKDFSYLTQPEFLSLDFFEKTT